MSKSAQKKVCIFPEDVGDESCRKIFYSVCDKTGKELAIFSNPDLAGEWIKQNGFNLVTNLS